MRSTLVVVAAGFAVVAALAACRDEHAPTSAAAPPVPAPTPPGAIAPADAAVVPGDAPGTEADLKQHMRQHFAVISELQRAIARGHFDEAKQHAAWLAGHDEPLQDGWQTYVAELKAAASAVQTAADLPTAAALAAKLGRTCSKCHEARRAVVSFEWQPPPEEGSALVAQMRRHQWAAARLWDGLVGPSDALWSEGAGVLADTHLDAAQATGGVGRADIPALAAKVRELSRRAGKVADHDERARLYGELLSTCAGCHQLVRPNPVP